MPFYDLNVAYTDDHASLSHTLAFLHELDYAVVALTVSVSSKLPSQLPVVITSRLNPPAHLKLITRLTLTVADTSQNHRINTLTSTYDLVALRPTTEKALQLCCSALDCDLISLDLTQRLPFPIKFKTVASALQRGVRFEICYSAGITGGNDARRNLISGAAALVRATRGRGIILSSEAKTALALRAPYDAINLATVWGLSQERAKEAICEEAGRLLRLAEIKRTSFRGVVNILDDGSKEVVNGQHSSILPLNATPLPVEMDGNTLSDVLPPLKQVTVVPDKTDKAKRKASQASLNDKNIEPKNPSDDKPLSKREMKRQTKKARLHRALGKGDQQHQKSTLESHLKPSSKGFPIQHEALQSVEKKG